MATSAIAPTSTPQASAWAIPTSVAPHTPAATTKAICVAFHITGETYERKKCRWLLRMPVQYADSTRKAMPGNMIRRRVVASSSCSPEKPGVITRVSGCANRIPRATTAAMTVSRRPRILPASRLAACRSSSSSREYTGMNDADSTPSPSRFWSRFGILSAALKTSAVAPTPR